MTQRSVIVTKEVLAVLNSLERGGMAADLPPAFLKRLYIFGASETCL